MATSNIRIPSARSSAAQRIIALGVVFAFFYWASSIVVTVMLAVLFAYFLDPVVVALERIHVPRALGALIVLLVATTALAAVGYFLVNRMQSFAEAWPRYSALLARTVQAVDAKLATIERQISAITPSGQQRQPTAVSVPETSSWPSWLLRGLGSITSSLFLWAFLPFLIVFMLTAKARLWRATLELFPESSRAEVRSALDEVNRVLRNFVMGSSLVAAILVATCWIFFGVIHLDYPFVTGLFSGLLNLIPYIGAPLAWLPPFLIGLEKWHTIGPFLGVAAVLSVLHLIAANLLMPAIVGRQVQLNALAVTLALLFWGWMWGAVGLILAIPVTATLKVICDHVPEWQAVGRWLGA